MPLITLYETQAASDELGALEYAFIARNARLGLRAYVAQSPSASW